MVVLRAEFETQTCDVEKIGMVKDAQRDMQNVPQNAPQTAPQNSLQNGVQYSMQKEEQASHQLEKECIPQVRRLAWRMLYAS